MNLTLRALGALLTYPDGVLIAAVPELRAVLEADLTIPAVLKPRVRSLLDYLGSSDPWALEEAYVDQFDTGRSTSLHLFEHVHGESKDRGQAMVDLRAQYEAAGLTLVPEELPDYLPAFLEYLSVIDPAEAAGSLGDCAPILEALSERLTQRQSPWAAVFPVLLALGAPATAAPLGPVKPELSLDAEWAEEPAFGPPPGGC
jgi:nitrate reductase delta subunit